jgi:hypothetical protein
MAQMNGYIVKKETKQPPPTSQTKQFEDKFDSPRK